MQDCSQRQSRCIRSVVASERATHLPRRFAGQLHSQNIQPNHFGGDGWPRTKRRCFCGQVRSSAFGHSADLCGWIRGELRSSRRQRTPDDDELCGLFLCIAGGSGSARGVFPTLALPPVTGPLIYSTQWSAIHSQRHTSKHPRKTEGRRSVAAESLNNSVCARTEEASDSLRGWGVSMGDLSAPSLRDGGNCSPMETFSPHLYCVM